MSLMFDVSTAGRSTQARIRGVGAKGQGYEEWELDANGWSFLWVDNKNAPKSYNGDDSRTL